MELETAAEQRFNSAKEKKPHINHPRQRARTEKRDQTRKAYLRARVMSNKTGGLLRTHKTPRFTTNALFPEIN